MLLIGNINKCIYKFTDIPFLYYAVIYIKQLISKDNITFDNHENYIPHTNGKLHLRNGKLESIVKED